MEYFLGFKYLEGNTKEDLNTRNNLFETGNRLSHHFFLNLDHVAVDENIARLGETVTTFFRS